MTVSIISLFQGGSYVAVVREAALQVIDLGTLGPEDLDAVVAAAICCWDIDAARNYSRVETGSKEGLMQLVDQLSEFNIKAAVATLSTLSGRIGLSQMRSAILGKARSVLVLMTPKMSRPDFGAYAAEIGVSVEELMAATVPVEGSRASQGWGSKKITKIGEVAAAAIMPGLSM